MSDNRTDRANFYKDQQRKKSGSSIMESKDLRYIMTLNR